MLNIFIRNKMTKSTALLAENVDDNLLKVFRESAEPAKTEEKKNIASHT